MTSALLEALAEHARLRPHELAVREVAAPSELRSLTWSELHSAVCRAAGWLGEGSRVLVCAPNGIELLVAILGGLRAGAWILPISPDVPETELRADARAAQVTVAIAAAPALGRLTDLVAELIPLESLAQTGSPGSGSERVSTSGSLLLKTSGTSGVPRLVRRAATALDAVGLSCQQAIGISESDTMLVAIPLWHSYGIDQAVLCAMIAGCALELQRGFDPGQVRSALLQRQISVLPGVPTIFDALARLARQRVVPPRLRRAYSAGSPLPRRVFDEFERSFGAKLGQIYGATEFGSATFNDPHAAGFDPGAAGLPFPGVSLRILNADAPNLDRALPGDCEGQLAVSAASMFSEYLDGDGSALECGFLLTGDLGHLDGAGRLRLTGRLRLLIDVGGIKINPLEVESVLLLHPGVRDAVVLPAPISDVTSRLRAVIVPEPGTDLSADELRHFARRHLIHYKVPRTFEIRDDVPRSSTGKILRNELRSRMEQASD